MSVSIDRRNDHVTHVTEGVVMSMCGPCPHEREEALQGTQSTQRRERERADTGTDDIWIESKRTVVYRKDLVPDAKDA